MSVQEKLRQPHIENDDFIIEDPIAGLPPETRENVKQGEEMIKIATDFLERTGIKLALFEFNQDLLDNKGRLDTSSGLADDIKKDGTASLRYSAQLTLKWNTPENDFYTLRVGINGDLFDTYETEDGGEEHVKKIAMTMHHATNPTDPGDLVSQPIEFTGYFDIYDPEKAYGSNILFEAGISDNSDTEMNTENYIHLTELEDAREIGGSTFKNWTEANIAGFISFIRREQHRNPLILPAI